MPGSVNEGLAFDAIAQMDKFSDDFIGQLAISSAALVADGATEAPTVDSMDLWLRTHNVNGANVSAGAATAIRGSTGVGSVAGDRQVNDTGLQALNTAGHIYAFGKYQPAGTAASVALAEWAKDKAGNVVMNNSTLLKLQERLRQVTSNGTR